MLIDLHQIEMNAEPGFHNDLRRGYREFLAEYAPQHFITFNFNNDTSLMVAHAHMERCLKMIEHCQHGRNWCRKAPELRPVVIGFMEHPTTNVHWHCGFQAQGDWRDALYEGGPAAWAKIMPGGQFHAKNVYDAKGLAGYVTKDQAMRGYFDTVLLYGPKTRENRR